MTPGSITPDDFDALCRRAGLTLSPDQRERLWAARGIVEAMIARIWRDLPREAEPAHIFTAAPALLAKRL
jgi:hypothetical protein